MSEAGDPFSSWLSSFREQVDDALSESTAGPSSPAARDATRAFDDWRRTESSPGAAPPVFASEAGGAPPAPRPRDDDSTRRVEALAVERAQLQARVSELNAENADLRGRQAEVQSRIAEVETRLSRSRESYETHIGKLEHQVQALEQQLRLLGETKAALDAALGKLADENKRLSEELRQQRERGGLAENENVELRHRLAEESARCARLREEAAEKAGAVLELRNQASVYQARLVDAKELGEAEIAGLRQEMRYFIEELKLVKESLIRRAA